MTAPSWVDDSTEMRLSRTDPERFGAIFDAHFAEIHRYVASRPGPSAAEDVVAETFLTAFRKRTTYDASRGGVRTWLYGIATNLVGKQKRTEMRALRALGRRGSGLGLVAAAAAVAVAVTTLGGGSSSAPSARPTELSARTILLAAADKAATEPGGRYWRLHTVGGATGRVEDGAYTILGPGEFDNWQSKSEQETDTVYQRELAAHPLTAADKAAWRKAGSPATFKVRNNADWVTYTTRNGQWTTQRITPAMKRQAAAAFAEMCKDPAAGAKCARGRRTWAEREKLASDPKTFQRLLFPPAEEGLRLSPANKLQQGYNFLIEQPASPAVRAKAFRLLADLPGVRYVGRAKSPDGRVGIAVAARGDMIDGSGVTFEYEFFLDPKTYKLLGDRETIVGGVYRGLAAGTLLNQQSVLFAGWTSDSPRHS